MIPLDQKALVGLTVFILTILIFASPKTEKEHLSMSISIENDHSGGDIRGRNRAESGSCQQMTNMSQIAEHCPEAVWCFLSDFDGL